MHTGEPPPDTNLQARTTVRRGNEPPRTPRWVRVFGIVAVVLLLAFVVLHLTGLVPMHLSMHR